MKRRIERLLRSAGYELLRLDVSEPEDGLVSLESLAQDLARIPGMIGVNRCIRHYLMAYSQSIRGDIAEIGSWQGRNTCFLAAACRDADNGVVHAIDHFKGNPGKERFYRVSRDDLSDLETNFRANVERAGLGRWVELHATESASVNLNKPLRLLFIDGEHTYEAVQRDLGKFAPLVQKGGLVVFDDYAQQFPGVVAAANEWASQSALGTPVRTSSSLIAIIN